MTKKAETGIQLHAAVQQALVTAPIAEKPVIETYQKIALQYNFPAIKTLEQAYDSGLWVKSQKKFDAEQLLSHDSCRNVIEVERFIQRLSQRFHKFRQRFIDLV